MSTFINVLEAAVIMGVESKTVRRAIKNGHLRAVVFSGVRGAGGKKTRLLTKDVEDYVTVTQNKRVRR